MQTLLLILMITSGAALLAMVDQKRKEVRKRQKWLRNLKLGDKVWFIPEKRKAIIGRNLSNGSVLLSSLFSKPGEPFFFIEIETYKIEPVDETEYVYVIDREVLFGDNDG